MPETKSAPVVNGGTQFGFRLLRGLAGHGSAKNVFISPLSISQCLTLALNGAGGQTRQEMAAMLGVSGLSQDKLNQENAALTDTLAKADPLVQLTIANALWADQKFTFNPDFQKRCAGFYGAKTATLDFASPSAADTINAWVRQKTKDKIDHLVSSDDTKGASAILTNAVYFHGKWTNPFNKAATHDGAFHLEGGQDKTLPLMAQTGKSYPYFETAQFQAASLPYGNGRASLYVFLPKSGVTLNDFLTSLDGNAWHDWMTQFHPTPLALTLPRFRVEYAAEFGETLGKAGHGGGLRARRGLSADGLEAWGHQRRRPQSRGRSR